MVATAISPTGFLTIDQTAGELGIDPLGIQRLIARNRIKASRIGADGPYRVAASELARYIGTNAPDLHGPKLTANGEFVTADTLWPAQQFVKDLLTAAQDQIPAEPPANAGDVPLTFTPAMVKVAQGQPKRWMVNEDTPVFADAATAYLVDRLRSILEINLHKVAKTAAALYDPDEYDQLVSDAMAALAKERIVTEARLPFTEPTGTRDSNGNTVKKVGVRQVRFFLPTSAMMTAARRTATVESGL